VIVSAAVLRDGREPEQGLRSPGQTRQHLSAGYASDRQHGQDLHGHGAGGRGFSVPIQQVTFHYLVKVFYNLYD